MAEAGKLAELDAAFAQPGEVVVQAVHGLGGIGKSTLAAHWAAKRPEAVRWWITADSAAAVRAGTAALARALNPDLAERPAEVQVEHALQWLARHDGWLLVLDNVEDPVHVQPLLDRVSRGRVLITTRRATGWHHQASTISLGVLDLEDAADLFTRILTHHGHPDTSSARDVCKELGGLALAVEQAAAYCAETGTSPATYLEHFARWPGRMFAATAEGGDAERTIARVWHLTLDRLADTPLAGNVLRVLAWYAPHRIPRNLLVRLADPLDLGQALGRLIAYGMVTDHHDGTLSVHRLVQTLARTPDPHDRHRRAAAIDRARLQAVFCLRWAFPADVSNPEQWPRCRELLPHVASCIQRSRPDHDTHDMVMVFLQAAKFVLDQADPGGAIPYFLRAVAADERLYGQDDPRTQGVRRFLAGAYRAAGDPNRAVAILEQTLVSWLRTIGPADVHTLACRAELGGAYRAAGDARAMPMLRHALAACERVLEPNDPDSLACRNELACAYWAAGELDRALPLLKQTAAGFERALGPENLNFLHARGNLAVAYLESKDLTQAVPLLKQTVGDCSRIIGQDHLYTLSFRANLAGAYQMMDDPARAISTLKSALADTERAYGKQHPLSMAIRSNIQESGCLISNPQTEW
ncbi:tetratricopeptide repeat protein [Yinghuangia aomiensis]